MHINKATLCLTDSSRKIKKFYTHAHTHIMECYNSKKKKERKKERKKTAVTIAVKWNRERQIIYDFMYM